MKNLILLALLVAAGWYGWQHKGTIFGSQNANEAEFVNDSDTAILRLRLHVGDQTIVRERVDAHATERLPFTQQGNSEFSMDWQWEGREVTGRWNGGFFQQGPIRTRHRFLIDDGGGVSWSQEALPAK